MSTTYEQAQAAFDKAVATQQVCAQRVSDESSLDAVMALGAAAAAVSSARDLLEASRKSNTSAVAEDATCTIHVYEAGKGRRTIHPKVGSSLKGALKAEGVDFTEREFRRRLAGNIHEDLDMSNDKIVLGEGVHEIVVAHKTKGG